MYCECSSGLAQGNVSCWLNSDDSSAHRFPIHISSVINEFSLGVKDILIYCPLPSLLPQFWVSITKLIIPKACFSMNILSGKGDNMCLVVLTPYLYQLHRVAFAFRLDLLKKHYQHPLLIVGLISPLNTPDTNN